VRPVDTASGARLVATAGLLVFLVLLAIEHLLRGDLSPATHEISEYANGPHGILMTVGFIAWAVSLAATSIAVISAMPNTLAVRLIAVLLLIAAAGLVVTAIFHTQTVAGRLPAGVHRTLGGELHNLGSGTTLVALAAALTTSALGRTARSHATPIAIAVGTMAIVGVLALSVPHTAGLRQRTLVTSACIWQLWLLAACAQDRTAPA
jgi:Protein of unknown function (DUF998)